MRSEEIQEVYKATNVMERMERAWLFVISSNTFLMTLSSYTAVGLK